MNDMIVNPDKFQAMIKKKKHDVNINNSIILWVNSVTILGIEIDNKLNFEKHISIICKEASRQVDAIRRIKGYIGKEEK